MRDGEVVDHDIERLKAICGMLAATTAGERSNAASLATRQLKAMGLTWAQLVESAFSRTDAPSANRPRPQPGQPHYSGARPKQGRVRVYQGVSSDGAVSVLLRWLAEEPDLFGEKDADFIRGLDRQGVATDGMTPRQWTWAIALLVRVQRRAEASHGV